MYGCVFVFIRSVNDSFFVKKECLCMGGKGENYKRAGLWLIISQHGVKISACR